uniref:uncharacterized protein LOC120346682 isoform X2 n=1 Tax=Styela clava TaxID=7725 RepID=UPI00193A4D1F|nr:uncharacterized protein LOC120346682 isoform X2 [Styela clava]
MANINVKAVWRHEDIKSLLAAVMAVDVANVMDTDRRSARKRVIFERVQCFMEASGHHFTVAQCAGKWKKPKMEYQKMLASLNKSGAAGYGEITWPNFDEMNLILDLDHEILFCSRVLHVASILQRLNHEKLWTSEVEIAFITS